MVLPRLVRQPKRTSFLYAIRRGFILCLPLFVIGSFALIVAYFPGEWYQSFIQTIFNGHVVEIMTYINDGTLSIAALLLVMTISYSYGVSKKYSMTECVFMTITSLTGYLVLVYDYRNAVNSFAVSNIFASLLISYIGCKVYQGVMSFKVRLNVYNPKSDASFYESLHSILPIVVNVLIFAGVRVTLVAIFNTNDTTAIMALPLKLLFEQMGTTFGGGLLYVLFIHVLWFIGVHGSNVLESAAIQIFATNVVPVGNIVSKGFIDTFVLMGGCGTSLSLIIAILLTSKNINSKRIARLSIVPGIFNINEMLIFGLPVVMNVSFFIPFIIVPLVAYCIAYLATLWGFVPIIQAGTFAAEHTWTTPAIFSGYWATGSSWQAALIQVLILAVSILIYIPFVKYNDRVATQHIKEDIEELTNTYYHELDEGKAMNLLRATSGRSSTARMLLMDLVEALDKHKIKVFYQGQYNDKGYCYGAEALMKWKHPLGMYIASPLIIELAKEGQILQKLEHYIFQEVLNDTKRIIKRKPHAIISVNVTAFTILSDRFETILMNMVGKNTNLPQHINIEITEEANFSQTAAVIDMMNRLATYGFLFSVDDFGMGHTSLLYLQHNVFREVKLDGSLVRSLRTEPANAKIISSIVHLAKPLSFDVVAEYVETEQDVQRLRKLGVHRYQGYYFAMAVPLKDYLKRMNKIKRLHFKKKKAMVKSK